MPVNLSNRRPIPDKAEWLQTLQGNILKFHGRKHAAHIFFTLPSGREAARAALRALVRYVTSAAEQHAQTAAFKDAVDDGREPPDALFGSLLLTACGYKALELPDVATRFAEVSPGPAASFATGMQDETTRNELGDPLPTTWEPDFQRRIDGLLLLAQNNEATLQAHVTTARALFADEDTTLEMGHVIKNDLGQGIEHFGFADGRSQPLYLRSDFKDDAATREADGSVDGAPTGNWKPFEPLKRVLVRDPYVQDSQCHGSFLVFRKLEQNVKRFRLALNDLANQLTPSEGDAGDERLARAGALVVGRFQDGTPITQAPRPSGNRIPANDFNYAADDLGRRCPMQAHIRKVNPRSISGGQAQRQHRITRRSLPYGTHVRPDSGLELPEHGVGVLFMCYQASIRQQFAFMQSRWANTVFFPVGRTGADALVGQGPRERHRWPPSYDSSERVPFVFQQFVQLKGGGFFFAPSLPFLRAL